MKKISKNKLFTLFTCTLILVQVNAQTNIFPSSGNVGIGTTMPATRLQIFDGGTAAAASELMSLKTTYTANAAAKAMTWRDGANITGQIDTRFDGSKVNMVFGHLYNSAYSTADLMTILGNGNVGIGTTSPTKKLDVFGDAKIGETSTRHYLKIASSDFPEIRFQTPTDDETIRIGVAAADWPIYKVKNGDLYFYTGTTDRMDLIIPKAGGVAMALTGGNVSIGSVDATKPGYKLFVEQGILTEKVKVAVKTSANWSDYVFANNYKLKPLSEVESFVKDNKHLPGVPSAEEVVKNGIDVATMDAKLLEKIEELTLYMIEMKKEHDAQQKALNIRIEQLEKENASLKSSIVNLKQ